MNFEKLRDDRTRSSEADALLRRRDVIISSLSQMEGFTDVHVASADNATWSPKIGTVEVKQFVRDQYHIERNAIEAKLSKLYPDE